MQPEPEPVKPRPWRRFLLGAGVALLVCWMLFASLFTVLRVEGVSMSPTLLPGQHVVAFRYGTWARGDLVVFKNPHDMRELMVKRVHAMAGETVALGGGKLFVNGRAQRVQTTFFDELPERAVQTGHVFVLGDNHTSSLDSRRLGAVDEALIVGTVVFRAWPFGSVQ